MAEIWEKVSGYDWINYTDDAIFEIDHDNKTIQHLDGQTIVYGEAKSQYIRFNIDRYYDGIDLSDKDIRVVWKNTAKNGDINAVVNVERSEDGLRFGWLVPAGACQCNGKVSFDIEFTNEDETYVLKTRTYDMRVFGALDAGSVVPEPVGKEWYVTIQERCNTALTKAEEAVTSAAESADRAEKAAEGMEEIAERAEKAATQAAESETAASTSASEAEAAKTAAQEAETGAKTAQTSAEEAVESAKTYTEQAKSSATSASTSATEAAEHEANAGNYASTAESAKTAAQTAESNAKAAQTASETAQASAETAQSKAETAQVSAETAQGKAETSATNAATSEANAKAYSESAQTAQTASETAQGKAETAQSKAESAQSAAETAKSSAETSASEAATSAQTASDKAEAVTAFASDSEAWAVGTRDGEAVPETDETYQNNSKYYAADAEAAKTDIQDSIDGVAQEDTAQSTLTQINKIATLLEEILNKPSALNGFSMNLGDEDTVILTYTDPTNSLITDTIIMPTNNTLTQVVDSMGDIATALKEIAGQTEV